MWKKGYREVISSVLQYLGCREDYIMGKRERGLKFWGRKSNFFKIEGGEEYKIAGNFIHPWFKTTLPIYVYFNYVPLLICKYGYIMYSQISRYALSLTVK